MHILLIHQAFASLNEGGGTRHFEMARILSEEDHKTTIIASPISYLSGTSKNKNIKWITREEAGENISILRTYTYRALHRSFIHRVFSFLSFMVSSFLAGMRVKNIDVVWGTSPPIFQGATAWLISRLKRKPFIFEVRDLWPRFAVDMGVLKNRYLISASKWLERFLYSHADVVVVNSPGYVDFVAQRGAKRVELIPNGADPNMFNPEADGKSFREAHHLEEKFVVLYAGAHGMANDLGVVLQAAERMQDNQEVIFVFIGDGKEKKALMAQAEEMKLENVLFLPVIPKTEMTEAMAAANACIAILKPIKSFKTTYPNKVFDYMAAGKPVILAIDGVIREVVEKADAGTAVGPGNPEGIQNAIVNFLLNPEKAGKMGNNGRDYVKKYFDRKKLTHKFSLLLKEFGE